MDGLELLPSSISVSLPPPRASTFISTRLIYYFSPRLGPSRTVGDRWPWIDPLGLVRPMASSVIIHLNDLSLFAHESPHVNQSNRWPTQVNRIKIGRGESCGPGHQYGGGTNQPSYAAGIDDIIGPAARNRFGSHRAHMVHTVRWAYSMPSQPCCPLKKEHIRKFITVCSKKNLIGQ